jgi:lipoyl(octanoyl) transferase
VDVWRLLPFRKADAAENMAVDEAVFRESIRKKVPPTLRFYGWLTPVVSIGYFQDVRREIDIEGCRRLGIGLIRRPTGGKAVLHDRELTYAVIASPDESHFPPDILRTYRVISNCLAKGLSGIGIRAELKAEGRPSAEEALRTSCFSTPSRYELLVNGKKLCGSSQMRSHGAFLQHGALLMAFDPLSTCAVMLPHREPERQAARLRDSVTAIGELTGGSMDEPGLSRALREGFEQELGIRFEEGGLTPEEEALSAELMMKYRSDSWNREGSQAWISGF